MSLNKTNIMPRKFGIEYTFVPKYKKSTSMEVGVDYHFTDYLLQIESEINKRYPSAKYRVHPGCIGMFCDVEEECLEIPSPPHKSIKAAENFYKKIKKITKQYNLVPRRIDRDKNGVESWWATGGGHIHIDVGFVGNFSGYDRNYIPLYDKNEVEWFNRFWRNLNIIIINNPWLTWVFEDWTDNWNSNPLIYHNELIKMISNGDFNKNPNYTYISILEKFANQKEAAVTFRNYNNRSTDCFKTLEFRFFDAPRSWSQVKDHVLLAQSIVNYAKKMTDQNTNLIITLNKKDVKKLYYKKNTERAFKSLVSMLNLDWNKYKKYMGNFMLRKINGSFKPELGYNSCVGRWDG